MKNKILILAAGTMLFLFSCSKESKESIQPNQANVEAVVLKNQNLDSEGYLLKKPIIKFRWEGIINNGHPTCPGGNCGACIGFCIIFRGGIFDENKPLSPEQIAEGIGTAKIKLSGNNLFMEPDTYCDNGDGYLRITDYYTFDSELSSLMGYNRVTIKPGTYKIHYSADKPNGKIKFDVIKD